MYATLSGATDETVTPRGGASITLRGMAVPAPTDTTRWRCAQCGNLTRFDVVRRSRVREFMHVDLAGAAAVEERTVLDDTVEHVTCRWCGATDRVELVEKPGSSIEVP
jgi:RNase P subunit RPR2